MMSDKKFKVGDRVRFIGDSGPWFEHQITNGDEGTVVGKGICNDDVCVSFPIADIVDIEDLEMIEPTDPRTEFLQELRELLTKYNVTIDGGCLGWDSEDPFVCFDSKDFKLAYCEEYCSKFKFPLTPDNIMDYEE